MSFPRYPRYRDSGVEWLGMVPAHWEVLQLRRVIERIEQGWSPECDSRRADVGEWGVLKSGCVNGGRFNPLENKALPDHLQAPPGLEVLAGDLLMSRASGSPELVGSAALVTSAPSRLLLSDKIFRLHLTGRALKHFLAWGLYSCQLRAQIERAISGAAGLANNLPQSSLVELVAALPPPSEQRLIAAFLDRETAKIDALIEEQKRLIELLKEQRQAVISQAVTKGLDPNVPMKDSGVAWLGDVPAHWRPMPIRFAARLESGHTPSRSRPDWWENCTVRWFTLADVWQIREGGADAVYDTKEKVSELGLANSSARLLPKGTVILSRTASVGFSAIMGVDMATTQDFANWVCGEQLLPQFLLCVFRSMSGEFRRLMMGSTHNTT